MRVGVDPTARHTAHYEPWPGIRGRQHGEVNETIPATNARANDPRTLMACPGEHIVERGLHPSIPGTGTGSSAWVTRAGVSESVGYDFSVLVGRMGGLVG
jgi:hypothetical protein